MYRKAHAMHHHDPHFLNQYYLKQVGSGMPFYRGSTGLQKGYGLGGLLGGLFRSAMPLLKKGAAAIGKQALHTGLEIAEDVMGGQNVKSAAKKRIKQAGKQLGSKAIRKIQTGKGKKRKNNNNRKSRAKIRRTSASATRKSTAIKRRRVGQNARRPSNKRRRRTYNDVFS